MAKANNGNNKIGTGLGIAAAVAAAAAGAYYFYGSNDATKHRKQLKGWMVKAKGDVMEKLEGMKEVTKDTYEKAVNDVMKKYEKVKNASPEELTALAKQLHGHWKSISGSLAKKPAARKKVSAKK
jgi:hypothetical protein